MDQKILERIKKCLALAGSDNPNEAATALRQAQALMARHGITGADLELSEVSEAKVGAGAGKTPPSWVAALANLVCSAFGVEVVYSVERHGWDTWKGMVKFIGVNGSPEIAGYAYEVLLRQLKKGRADFLKTLDKRLKRATKTRRGDLYVDGWISAVRQQVTPTEVSQHSKDLVTRWKSANHGNLVTAKTIDRTEKARAHDYGAYWQGKSDGEKVSFNQGVRADQQQTARLEAAGA